MESDYPIHIATHFFCAGFKKDEKTINRIAETVSNMEPDDIFLFAKALGTALIGMAAGQEKIIKNYDKFIERICKTLNKDSYKALGI